MTDTVTRKTTSQTQIRWWFVGGVALALSVSSGGGMARAEPPADAPAAGSRSLIGKNCATDVAKLCAGIEAGGGRLARCLHGHQDELGPECKAALERGGWKMRAVAGAASPSGEPPSPSKAAPPAPSAPPSPASPPSPRVPEAGGGPGPMGPGGAAHARMEAQMSDMRAACGTDVEKFCKGVRPGMGRIARCLGEHTTDLAPACKTKVDAMLAALGSDHPPMPPMPQLDPSPLSRPPPGPPPH